MSFQCISVDEAKKIIDDNNLTIIDIRDYNSFLQGHIDNAIHVENLDIDSFINKKIKVKPY
jgi:rhodanese-related sulfurtransferase